MTQVTVGGLYLTLWTALDPACTGVALVTDMDRAMKDEDLAKLLRNSVGMARLAAAQQRRHGSQCKGAQCVDLGESFQTHMYLQNLASIQPRTSPLKFVGSRDS